MTETEGPHWIIRLIREEEVWWYGGNATLTSRTLSTREGGAFWFDNRVDAERQAQSFRNQGVADKVEVVEVT